MESEESGRTALSQRYDFEREAQTPPDQRAIDFRKATQQFVPAKSLNYFDLEDVQSLARLTEPDMALRPLKGLVVIDEIQRRPDLFPLLRVLADRKPLPARFLILGSASIGICKCSLMILDARLLRMHQWIAAVHDTGIKQFSGYALQRDLAAELRVTGVIRRMR